MTSTNFYTACKIYACTGRFVCMTYVNFTATFRTTSIELQTELNYITVIYTTQIVILTAIRILFNLLPKTKKLNIKSDKIKPSIPQNLLALEVYLR